MGGNKAPAVSLADRGAVPLISVIVPAVQAVTSSVTFTGAIAARYDMPIANEGDTGRIVGGVRRGRRPREARPGAGPDRRLGDGAAGQPPRRLPRAGEGPGRAVGRRIPSRAGRRGRRRAVRGGHREAPRDLRHRCGQRQGGRRAARRGAGAPEPHPPRRPDRGRRAHPQRRGGPDRQLRRRPRCFASRAAARSRCAARSPSRTWRR